MEKTEKYTDSAFVIGLKNKNAGKPCQDYALSGKCIGGAYAVVSDGCSSGRYTDVGARTIVHSTVHALENGQYTPKGIVGALEVQKKLWGLKHEDMLATLDVITETNNDILLRIFGDGVIAVDYGDEIVMYRFDWDKNIPFYLEYYNCGYNEFSNIHNVGKMSLPVHVEVYSTKTKTSRATRLSFSDGVSGTCVLVDESVARSVAIFSDGVTQIDGVDWKDAVQELLAFKTIGKDFAKRRLRIAVRGWEKKGRGPIDDLSIGVIVFKKEEGCKQ